MPSQQLHESTEVFVRLHLVGHDATLVGLVDALQHPFAEAFFRGTGMERVVDTHPAHGEIAAVTELPVTHHLLREVTELYVENPSPHTLGKGTAHDAE